MLKIYLDNCCYNRPFDGQEQFKVFFETNAKIFIQELIKRKAVKLYSSFVLIEEVKAGKDEEKKNAILEFINGNYYGYVAKDMLDIIKENVDGIMATGVKDKDAVHIACAELAECDYFITTDKRLLKYQSPKVKVINPTAFRKIWEEQDDV